MTVKKRQTTNATSMIHVNDDLNENHHVSHSNYQNNTKQLNSSSVFQHVIIRNCKTFFKFSLWNSKKKKQKFIVIGVLLGLATLSLVLYYNSFDQWDQKELRVPTDPEFSLPPSPSILRVFKRGAVCADGPPCSDIGKQILEKNGSAVDAAVATMICNGLINTQSMGIGGGHMMTIYQRESSQAYILNARDRAPLMAHSRMYDDDLDKSFFGPLAIAVPGEIAGYWEAHKRFGKLRWSELFEPSIELCVRGYNMSVDLQSRLSWNKEAIYKDPTLRAWFIDPSSNEFRKPGSILRRNTLCKTLKILAEKGGGEMYNGTLAKILVQDLQKKGSIITMKDFNDYRAEWDSPISTVLSNGVKVFTPGSPGSGGILSFILKVLDGFQFNPDYLKDINTTANMYHKITETFKYAYAMRTKLADKNFVNITETVNKLLSKEFAADIRKKIEHDNHASNDPMYYGAISDEPAKDHGTSHVSVLAPNGDAVSVTSTINYFFGSGLVSERTGILFNDAMDDFSVSNKINYYGIHPTQLNHIEPGKRPMSSMTPSILVNPDGTVKIVIGSAGGTKITTAVAQVVTQILWMGSTVKEAVDAPRLHHQLLPNQLNYEYGFVKSLLFNLKKYGHTLVRYKNPTSTVCAIVVENGTIYGNADYRKGGDVYGID